MSILRSPALRRYGAGLCAVVVGAGFTSLTESMLPLAMGSALAVICTAGLVREIHEHARGRHRRTSATTRR